MAISHRKKIAWKFVYVFGSLNHNKDIFPWNIHITWWNDWHTNYVWVFGRQFLKNGQSKLAMSRKASERYVAMISSKILNWYNVYPPLLPDGVRTSRALQVLICPNQLIRTTGGCERLPLILGQKMRIRNEKRENVQKKCSERKGCLERKREDMSCNRKGHARTRRQCPGRPTWSSARSLLSSASFGLFLCQKIGTRRRAQRDPTSAWGASVLRCPVNKSPRLGDRPIASAMSSWPSLLLHHCKHNSLLMIEEFSDDNKGDINGDCRGKHKMVPAEETGM